MKQIATQHLVIHPGFIKNTMIDTDGRHLCKYNPNHLIRGEEQDFLDRYRSLFLGNTFTLQCITFVREQGLWKDISSIHLCFIITLVSPPPRPSTVFLAFLSPKWYIGPQGLRCHTLEFVSFFFHT